MGAIGNAEWAGERLSDVLKVGWCLTSLFSRLPFSGCTAVRLPAAAAAALHSVLHPQASVLNPALVLDQHLHCDIGICPVGQQFDWQVCAANLQYAGFDLEESPEVEHIQFEVHSRVHCIISSAKTELLRGMLFLLAFTIVPSLPSKGVRLQKGLLLRIQTSASRDLTDKISWLIRRGTITTRRAHSMAPPFQCSVQCTRTTTCCSPTR